MINIFKKTKQVAQEVARAFEPVKDVNAVIEEIHNEFDGASERLLSEAKSILNGSYDINKGERLKKIGFVQSSKAVEANKILAEKSKNEELAKLIEYYMVHYPNNKFITEDVVKSICKKYGLLFGGIKYFISDVPEKNLVEIENFKLKKEDETVFPCGWYVHNQGYYYGYSTKQEKSNWGFVKLHEDRRWQMFYPMAEDVKVHTEPSSMSICASKKDFDTTYMRIEDGYKLELNLPDPIVLQPVNGGYLIVSKWGLEASDEDVVNEKMN